MKATSVIDLIAAFGTAVLVDVLREPMRPREVRQLEDDELDAERDRLRWDAKERGR